MSSSERRTIEDKEGAGQEAIRSLLAAAPRQSHGRNAMEEDTEDDKVHDTSTQGRVIGNSG